MKKNNIDPALTAGLHHSYWIDTVEPLFFSKAGKEEETDVVIVGGGIAGITVAYCLQNAGLRVVLVEDGAIGSGESGRTTAHLVNAIDDRYYEIERIFGEEGARNAAESHTAAIDFIEKTSKKEKIDCDFKRVKGYLFSHPSDKEDSLQKEFDAAKRAGLQVKLLSKIPHFSKNKSQCLEFSKQGQFHPLKYVHGLARAAVNKGGRIFTETRAKEIDDTGVVTEEGFKISAKHVVVATNSPVNNKYVMHLKQYAYRTYVIGATIPKDSIPHSLWWDTGDTEINSEIPPYHYVRIHPYDDKFDLLISGGEDHATGMPEANETTGTSSYAKLEGWIKSRFDIREIAYRWSGQVMEPMDGLGYIGHNPMDSDNVYIVTGDSGNGLTHGTIAGLLLTDLIQGKENPWQKIHDPSRTHYLKSGKTFVKEFFGGLIQYMKHSPKNTDKIRLSDIKKNAAEIVKMDKENYGAYRDENETLHIVSATCSHLGCTVRWNEDEKSWDCPCHGSRFSYEGKVLNGPANQDLLYYVEKAGVKG